MPEPEPLVGIDQTLFVGLSQMKIAGLVKRALAAGVAEDEMDTAEDSSNHKMALIYLIAAKESSNAA
jgi:hypothetical protein